MAENKFLWGNDKIKVKAIANTGYYPTSISFDGKVIATNSDIDKAELEGELVIPNVAREHDPLPEKKLEVVPSFAIKKAPFTLYVELSNPGSQLISSSSSSSVKKVLKSALSKIASYGSFEINLPFSEKEVNAYKSNFPMNSYLNYGADLGTSPESPFIKFVQLSEVQLTKNVNGTTTQFYNEDSDMITGGTKSNVTKSVIVGGNKVDVSFDNPSNKIPATANRAYELPFYLSEYLVCGYTNDYQYMYIKPEKLEEFKEALENNRYLYVMILDNQLS